MILTTTMAIAAITICPGPQENLPSNPMGKKYDTDLGGWYIENGMFQKHISIYLNDPKKGSTKTVTESSSYSRAKNWSIGANASVSLFKILSLGINGSLGGSNTQSVSSTTSYNITYDDRLLGSFTIDFFKDPVINSISGGTVTLPEKKIGNELWISILPNYYY